MTEKDGSSDRWAWRRSRWGVLVVASIAIFTDMLLYGMLIPIQPRLLERAGISRENMDWCQALLVGSYAAGLLMATPIFGVLSDRLRNRQIPMLAGLLALAISTVSFAYLRNFIPLVVARAAQGISAAATWVVGLAMVTDAYPSDDGLGFAIGLVLGVHTLGSFLGPVLGGLIGEYYGLQYPFLLCALLACLDLAGRLIINPPPPPALTVKETPFGAPVRHSPTTWQLLCCRDILLTLIAIFIYSSSFTSIEVFVAVWLESDWHLSESQTVFCMLGFILPNMILSVAVGWLADRLPKTRIIASGLILHGLAAPLIPHATTMLMFILFSVLFGASASIVSTPLMPYLASTVDRLGGASYARLYALFNMTYSLGMLVGPWLVSLAKIHISFSFGMLIIGLISLGYGPFFLLLSSKDERCPPPPMSESTTNLL